MSGPVAAARSPNPWTVAGAAVVAVVLGFAAATAGWSWAGNGGPRTPEGAAPRTDAAPGVTGQPPTRPSGVPPVAQVRVPNLAGTDAVLARRRLDTAGLATQLVFATSGDSRAVAHTDPAAGTTVRRGVTVKVFVRGTAPSTAVPGVVGVECVQAGAAIVARGLYIEYATGRSGRVLRQDPAPGTWQTWNGRVRIHCGATRGS